MKHVISFLSLFILPVFLVAQQSDGLRPATTILVQDEGISQGRVKTLNCVGAGISCTASGIVGTLSVSGGGGGSFTLTNIEKDLGSLPLYSGTFDITGLVGLTPNANVLVTQAAGPYTNKGDRQDEAEMDLVTSTGYVVDANTIRVYWTCQPYSGPVAGNVKFNYVVG